MLREYALLADGELPGEAVAPEPAWAATEYAWAQAIPEMHDTMADRDARHALAVLRWLTSAGGGMVAAASMSLPEQGRNYGQAVALSGRVLLAADR